MFFFKKNENKKMSGTGVKVMVLQVHAQEYNICSFHLNIFNCRSKLPCHG